jgi:hypothetical protein
MSNGKKSAEIEQGNPQTQGRKTQEAERLESFNKRHYGTTKEVSH